MQGIHRFVCLTPLVWAALSSTAWAQQNAGPLGNLTVQSGQVTATGPGTSRVLQVGCTARAAVFVEGALTVACDDGMLRTFMVSADGSLMPFMTRQVASDVRGLFVKDKRVWVEFEHAAQPIDSLGATAPPPPPPPPVVVAKPEATAEAEHVLTGKVLEVHGTDVVISIGRDEGLHGDAHVEIGYVDASPGIPTTVVGRVRDVGPNQANVRIGFGESVDVGQAVRTTARPTTDSFLAPQRQAPLLAVGADLRVLIPIGGLGIGTLADVWTEWHAKFPFSIRARLQPLAGLYYSSQGYGSPPTSISYAGGAFSADVAAAFDSRYFAIGLGVGVGQFTACDYTSSTCGTNYGFAVTQGLRIGALDGFSLAMQDQLLIANGGWQWGGLDGTIQVPVANGWWVVLRGGGTIAPYGFTDLGMRIALSGNGGPGTLFLTPTLGWAGVGVRQTNTTSPYYNSSLQAGPTAGIGIEYRIHG